jgi:hypothetical protein
MIEEQARDNASNGLELIPRHAEYMSSASKPIGVDGDDRSARDIRRAVRVGNPNLVLAAAHELPKPVRLRYALRIVPVLATAAPDQFPAAAPGL